jgi:NAD(P)-dependent dehydrogenase (short-subunit alcohol dehydrogenase family)
MRWFIYVLNSKARAANMFLSLMVSSEDGLRLKSLCISQFSVAGLWAVVNNAGIWSLSDIERTSEAVFRRVLDINLFGQMRVSKTFLPVVRQSKGRFVNMSSLTGLLLVTEVDCKPVICTS